MRAEPSAAPKHKNESPSVPPPRASLRTIILLFVVTVAAVLVHGYHPFVEDAEIYVPGIKKLLNPALYPYNDIFFASHARLTFFPNLIACSARLTHLPLEWVLLAWHLGCTFSLLFATWKLGRLCFGSARAGWGSALLVASLLTIPVAGTALYIMDQYLNTRSLSTAAMLWIVLTTAQRKYVQAAVWLVLTALLHPLMALFVAVYAGLLLWQQRSRAAQGVIAALLLPVALFPPVTGAYRQVLDSRSYFFLARWEWYEWFGIVGPLLILWFLERRAKSKGHTFVVALCHTTIIFGIMFFFAALVITIPPQLARFAELQPMRSLHLVYILLFVIGGGWLAEWVGSRRELQLGLIACLGALNCGMFYAQRQLFPATPHIEWPGRNPENGWVEAFLWVRDHTPTDAYFALNPDHMRLPGEDQHGFRAIAERSMLADRVKDSGAVSMFPALAETWSEQVLAQGGGWNHFQPSDLEVLRKRYGVNWAILQAPGIPGLDCPYSNRVVLVCQIPATTRPAESQ
jgi:hypothetical protein